MAASRTLSVAVTGDTRDFERATARASSASGKFAKSTEHAHVRIRRSFMGMTASAAKAGAGIAAAYVSIEGAKRAISTTEDLAHATISLHKNLGLSVEKASEWAAVAKSRNIDTKALNMSFGTLSKNILASHDATSKQAEVFKQLGVSQAALRSGDFNRVLGDTADALQKMGPGADRTATAMKLFGRGWQTVVPVLRDGSKAMREQLKLAEDSGATFKGKSIKSLEDFIKAQRAAKLSVMGLQVAFGTELAPVLTKVLSSFSKFTREMRDGTGAGGRFASTMKRVWSDLKPIVSTAKDVAEWLGKHPHLLAVAGAAWVTYKTAALVQIAIVKAAELGLFGVGMRTRLASQAGKTGTAAGKGFAAKAGLAAAAGIAGWEIGTWLRKNVGPVRDAGDWLGKTLGKAIWGGVSADSEAKQQALDTLMDIGSPGQIPLRRPGPRRTPSKKPAGRTPGGGPRGTGRISAVASSAGGSGPTAKASRTFSHGELMQLWVAAGGPAEVADTAAAIAQAESGGNQYAHNPSGASGLWQILGQVVPGNIYDPMINARNAVKKYRDAGGWSPWTVYTGYDTPGHAQTYKQYLTGASAPAGGGALPSGALSRTVARVKSPYESLENLTGYIDLQVQAGTITEAQGFTRTVTAVNKALPKLTGSNRLRALAMRRAAAKGIRDRLRAQKQAAARNRATARAARTVDPTLENPWLTAYLTHQDYLAAIGQQTQAQANEYKGRALQGAINSGQLSEADVITATETIRGFQPEAPEAPTPEPFSSVLSGALSDIDLSVRAGDISEADALQAKIALIQGNLGNPDLSERERLELRAELGDLTRAQNDTVQALKDHTAALKDNTDQLKRQTDMAEAVQSTESFQLKKYLADVLSGQFGRGVVARSFTPGAGVEVAY